MKKKISVFVVLIVLFSVLGFSADWYMKQQAPQIIISDNSVRNYLQRSIPSTAIYYSEKNDPETQTLYVESADPNQAVSLEPIQRNIDYFSTNFVSDPAVKFWLVDKESDRVVDGDSQETYDAFKANPTGWSKSFETAEGIMQFMQNNDILYHMAYEGPDIYAKASFSLSDKYQYVVNIQEKIAVDQYSSVLNDMFPTIIDHVQNQAGIMLALGAAVISLVLLILPIQWVSEFPIYKGLWKTKMEWSIILIGILAGGSITAAIILSPYFYSGNQSLSVIRALPISMQDFQKSGPIWWMLAFIFISTALFYLKRVITYGIFRSYKEKSYGGSFLRYIKGSWHTLMTSPVRNDLKKRVNYASVVNFVVIFICLLFGPFGFVLAVIYTVISTLYILRFIHTIQMDYNTMHQHAKDIAQGKFHTEAYYYTGLFQPISAELNTINTGFDQAVKEAMASQYTKAELITNVSHDLKTPLTGIRNYTELLQDPEITEEKRSEYLERMNAYTVRMTKLIEDLFEISKATANDIKLERQNLDINNLIDQVLLENQDALEGKHLELVKAHDGGISMVYLDADKAYRIFDNLIQNISKYAMPHTRVYIDVKTDGECVSVELKNISKDPLNFDAKEIQERFIRGDKSRSEEGSGLGLAIAEKFTTLQDGQFDIQIDGDLFKAQLRFPIISE